MNFQARHYRQIATLIATLRADALDRGDLYMQDTIRSKRRLIETFQCDNPRFNPDRFTKACTS